MRPIGRLIRVLAVLLNRIGGLFERGSFILNGLLPALLPAAELTKLIRAHYDSSYRDAYRHFSNDQYEWSLEKWEEDVLHRHKILSGTMLVLGAGVGRETIALAKLGLWVVGLDINHEALRTAARMGRGTPAVFVQADFTALPFGSIAFDYILLSGIMYSSIPGRRRRQAWLRSLSNHLKDGGCAVLNFLVDRWPSTRSRRLVETFNRLAVKLPGANPAYQAGDTCAQCHFLHAFKDEAEIMSELLEAGVTVEELNWSRGFAVLTFPQTVQLRA